MAGVTGKDLSVYVVTDPLLVGDRDLLTVVEAVYEAGVRTVQLRDKNAPTRVLVTLARKMTQLARRHGALLLVNDRLDVALAADAHGVHLGQEDMHPADARRLLGKDAVIGVSVRTLDQAREAVESGADYVAASHVFPTGTKSIADPPIGLEGVTLLAGGVDLPLVGIGGIGPDNADQVIQAGAEGVAVVSAVMAAPDVRAACSDLMAAVERGRAARREGRP